MKQKNCFSRNWTPTKRAGGRRIAVEMTWREQERQGLLTIKMKNVVPVWHPSSSHPSSEKLLCLMKHRSRTIPIFAPQLFPVSLDICQKILIQMSAAPAGWARSPQQCPPSTGVTTYNPCREIGMHSFNVKDWCLVDFSWVALVLCVGSKLLIIWIVEVSALITIPLKVSASGWLLCIHGAVVLHLLGLKLVRWLATRAEEWRCISKIKCRVLQAAATMGFNYFLGQWLSCFTIPWFWLWD